MATVVQSFVADGESTATVTADLDRQLAAADISPDFIFVFYGQCHDDELLARFIRERFPRVPAIGGTSSAGVMSQHGLAGPQSIGLLLIHDPDGSYGSSAAEFGEDPATTASAALLEALVRADASGELPELIWVYQTPGQEEAVLRGLQTIVGDRCPIIGGSAADDDVSGRWRVLGSGGPLRAGVTVGVLFPSGGIGFEFQGGYEPAGPSGVVTQVDMPLGAAADGVPSSRNIIRIDDQPAAAVYDDWLGHTLPRDVMTSGGTVLAETTTAPLGVMEGMVEGIATFRLIHPATISDQQGVTTFAQIAEGTRVYCMRGNPQKLVSRAGSVTRAATETMPGGIAGGIIVFCGGCLMAVGDHAEQLTETVSANINDNPFIGCFTFGEQGMLLSQNIHANLMISAVIFGK